MNPRRFLTNDQYNELVATALADPRRPLCILCRRRHRPLGVDGTPRPPWADAWHDWDWLPSQNTMYKTTPEAFISIDEDGVLVVDNYYCDEPVLYELNTPDDAKVVADAIASVTGGWSQSENGSESEPADPQPATRQREA